MEIIVEEPGRIDKIIAKSLPQYSRAALVKLFDIGNIELDGIKVRPGHKARIGARITIDLSPLQQEQQIVELPVIYEDEDVIVIDKPAGIISHARGRYWYEPSVASFVRSKVANATGDRAGIVHRLDRATSGIMICAKNEPTTTFLQKQFSDRTVQKTYIAILEKTPKEMEAVIDAPIERNPKKPSTFRVGANGKAAQTHYKVIKQFGDGSCLVGMTPKTGRTHQLRIHAQFIGCPIVGDPLYGNTQADRLMLHAHSLTLRIPKSGEVTFLSPLPKEFSL